MVCAFRRAALVLAACALAGCRPSTPVEQLSTARAAGVVLFHGKPLADATVAFISLDGQVSSRGVTDDRGEFVLSTYGPGDGAPAGKYKVLVSLDEFEVSQEGRPVPKPKKRTGPPPPARYARQAESPLAAEVTPSGPNQFSFELR